VAKNIKNVVCPKKWSSFCKKKDLLECAMSPVIAIQERNLDYAA
jgi:hypothetical protein